MKEEWKPDALRETAEEIRSAVMPKSITPEMVGGTLLALTNAVGEVVETLGEIPREHVKVTVRGYDGTGGVSGASATVWLDMFAVGGFPTHAVPRQELTTDENGVVEFDVPLGYKYAVSSHIDGLGASFQLVFDAVAETRTVNLWNFPVGVWALGHTDVALYADEDAGREYDRYRAIPFITESFTDDIEGDYGLEVMEWDIDSEAGECSEGGWYIGILVSTVDTTFAIGTNNLSDKSMEWCDSRDRNTLFPLLDYAVEKRAYDIDWETATEKARQDMDGNMNTAKILAFSPTHTAARWAAGSPSDYDEQRFLPSAGQLYIMWLNRTAINTLAQQTIDVLGWDNYYLLPYQGNKGGWILPNKDANGNSRNEYWWSSSVVDSLCSWVVDYNGYININNRNLTNDVRAVSAFHFEY